MYFDIAVVTCLIIIAIESVQINYNLHLIKTNYYRVHRTEIDAIVRAEIQNELEEIRLKNERKAELRRIERGKQR